MVKFFPFLCGSTPASFKPISLDVWGPHNSQHLLDPYSFTHVLHGVLLYGAFAWLVPCLGVPWRLFLAVTLECLWELLENSGPVIERYRSATAALGYGPNGCRTVPMGLRLRKPPRVIPRPGLTAFWPSIFPVMFGC